MYFRQDADDAALVARTLGGDLAAFEAIVVEYERVLYRIALRMLGDREDARDATQTALVRAYANLGRFDSGQRFFSWLYRILLNECLNVRRDRRPQEPVTPDMAVASNPDPVEASERRYRVQQALLALTPEYREVIVLRHFADLGYDEIAATLGVPSKTVKSRLYTARQRLCELLIPEKTDA